MFLRNKKQKFSIRKLSAGAASVLVATSVLGGAAVEFTSGTIYAEEKIVEADFAKFFDLMVEKKLYDEFSRFGYGKKPEEVLASLKQVLKDASPQTLNSLINTLDK